MQIIVQGLAVSYEEQGSGPGILLLHGWGSNLRVFDGITAAMADAFRVVRFDWPGFGGSQTPPPTWGIQEFAAFTKAFCDKIGLLPQAIIGHSMGGQVAVRLVGSQLLQPTHLVLIGAAAVRPARSLRTNSYMLAAKTGKLLLGKTALGARLRKRLYASAGTEDYLGTHGMQEIYGRIVNPREDQRELARNIKIPALLIWGDRDQDTPLERARLLEAAIPDARLEVVPGAGHYVMLDASPVVTRLLREFLS